MVVPSAGEVVLVPFPFSDLSESKVRPALCLADAGRSDWILAQITSNRYGDSQAMPLAAADFSAGGLLVSSFVRPGKLFTASSSLMIRSIAKLHDTTLQKVLDSVVHILHPTKHP